MTDPTTALREVLALSERFKAWECAGDELRCDDGNGCECEMAGNLCPDAPGGALAFIDKHGPALLSALEDARRLRYLMGDACVEGFVGVDGDVHDFASYVADDNEREEPSADDYLEGFRRMIDAAIDAAIAEGEG